MGTVLARTRCIGCFISVWMVWGCGSEEGTAEESDTGTNTGTDTGEGTADGGVGTDPTGQRCPDFTARLVSCGASEEMLPEVQQICGRFESVFNEGFTEDLYNCMVQLSCDELLSMLERSDGGVGTGGLDAGIPAMPEDPSAVETCMMTAMLTAQPGPESEAFQQHYCDWLVSCDSTVGPNECQALFTGSELMFFSVMGDRFVLQADACVNPPPPCEHAQAVEICLQTVVENFGQEFGI
jgi:hypothetical protein